MRIRCPEETCGRSNRARRKTCGQCGTPIAHLRVEPPPQVRHNWEWPPNGTEVTVERSANGWHGGRLTGMVIRPGVVLDEQGYELEINHPRDIHTLR